LNLIEKKIINIFYYKFDINEFNNYIFNFKFINIDKLLEKFYINLKNKREIINNYIKSFYNNKLDNFYNTNLKINIKELLLDLKN